MSGIKGMKWKKEKINKKKINASINNITYKKLKILSAVGKKLALKKWSTPSAIISTLIEEDANKIINKICNDIPDINTNKSIIKHDFRYNIKEIK